jgi:signal transduction histidine kinase
MKDTFHKERVFLETAQDRLLAEDVNHQTYLELLQAYGRLLKQSEKIVRIGDASQNKLLRARFMLERALQRYRTTAEQKSELIGIITHDLKNKAGAIKGLTDALIEEMANLPVAPHDLLGMIQKTALELLHSAKLSLERESQQDKDIIPVFEWVDVRELVDEEIERLKPQITCKQIAIHWERPTPFEAYIDAFLMGEIIENLLSNALKFSESHKNVHISLTKNESTFCISIKDEGPGLTPDDKEKLFGRFTRLSAQPTAGESSTGLGLSIVDKLVKAHRGSVWAESDGPGTGTTFCVEMPTGNI